MFWSFGINKSESDFSVENYLKEPNLTLTNLYYESYPM